MPEQARKIALEEHSITPGFKSFFETTAVYISPELFGRAFDALQDFGERRLEIMDAAGLDISNRSLAGPGVLVERNTAVAVRRAKECNVFLAEMMRDQPRFGGLAHLPMQDPAVASDELERCMPEPGYQGAMINGQTNGANLDEDQFSPFRVRAEALDAPIYIHPGNPTDLPSVCRDHSGPFGPVWNRTVETVSHALRLTFCGVFDRFPNAKLILGAYGRNAALSALAVRQPVENLPCEGANAQAFTLGTLETQPLDCDVRGLLRRTASLRHRGTWRRPGLVFGRPSVRAHASGRRQDRGRADFGAYAPKDLFWKRQSLLKL